MGLWVRKVPICLVKNLDFSHKHGTLWNGSKKGFGDRSSSMSFRYSLKKEQPWILGCQLGDYYNNVNEKPWGLNQGGQPSDEELERNDVWEVEWIELSIGWMWYVNKRRELTLKFLIWVSNWMMVTLGGKGNIMWFKLQMCWVCHVF